ncbi:MAG: serine/threonine-protein kinase, partial [Planctomycetota bacterium]
MTPGSAHNGGGGDGALPIGSKLGKYELLERLGAGGESIVYRAHDPFLDRHVAIKQIAPHLAGDQTYSERFREIARRLARLRCEEVIVIHELIEDERGVFVVMEFVRGHTIASTLANQDEPVEPRAVLQILWRVAAGLAEVHKAGIVHRDIKPGNIIIGEGLRVKITDFGVAAPAGVPASVRWGTARYMAPDLMSGVQVDARADIYSLGMVVYEMLAGRKRFNETFADIVRDTSPQVERDRWMKWHLDAGKAAPPLHEINPAVPEALSRIVAKMLAKDPEDRFRNVEELGREIRANFSPRAHRPAPRGERKQRLSIGAAAAADAEAATMASGPTEALAAGPAEPADE